RDEPAGEPPAAAVERDHPLHRPWVPVPRLPRGRGERQRNRDTGHHDPRGVGQRPPWYQRDGPDSRAGRGPGQVAHGKPVTVGGRQRGHAAGAAQAPGGEQGQGVVAAGGREYLRHGGRQLATVHGAGQRRGGRQVRVLRRGQGDQRELGTAAGEGYLVAV